jgi:hypothetical protein
MRETVPAAVTYGRFDNRVDAIAVKPPTQLEAGARSVRDSLASAPPGTHAWRGRADDRRLA